MRKAALIFIFAVVIAVGVPSFAATYLWVRMTDLYKGYTATEQFVDVPRGASVSEIGARLVDAGVVRDPLVFRAALWWGGRARTLKAGEYRFTRPVSAVGVVETLVKGDVYARRITFPEGLAVAEMATIYEARGFGSAQAFLEAARDPSPIRDLDPAARDLEGYLFPETYTLSRGTQASALVAMMAGRFLAVYDDDLRRRAVEQGMTARQVVTLASLVEKETGQAEERPLVAGVYRHRLKIGMPMQADPTVIYALRQAGHYDGNIRREDLDLASPYNTYKYPGLPPGPIASPGKASLEAALAPADVRYLYFVSRNDGSHVFSETLAQHNANVRKFQVEYFREERRRSQGEGGRGRGEGLSQGRRVRR